MALFQRLQKFLAPRPADAATAALYSACVAQAREAGFYSNLGVPDTIDGRFDLLLLHVFLAMRRLGDKGAEKQALFDLMFADMDRSLREMGVGDMGVGKRMKVMIAAFYGRARAYEEGLAGNGDALAITLQRNLYGKTPADPEKLSRFAAYVRAAALSLDAQSPADIQTGKIAFPAIA